MTNIKRTILVAVSALLISSAAVAQDNTVIHKQAGISNTGHDAMYVRHR